MHLMWSAAADPGHSLFQFKTFEQANNDIDMQIDGAHAHSLPNFMIWYILFVKAYKHFCK